MLKPIIQSLHKQQQEAYQKLWKNTDQELKQIVSNAWDTMKQSSEKLDELVDYVWSALPDDVKRDIKKPIADFIEQKITREQMTQQLISVMPKLGAEGFIVKVVEGILAEQGEDAIAEKLSKKIENDVRALEEACLQHVNALSASVMSSQFILAGNVRSYRHRVLDNKLTTFFSKLWPLYATQHSQERILLKTIKHLPEDLKSSDPKEGCGLPALEDAPAAAPSQRPYSVSLTGAV
jgi:hypothetical protein